MWNLNRAELVETEQNSGQQEWEGEGEEMGRCWSKGTNLKLKMNKF